MTWDENISCVNDKLFNGKYFFLGEVKYNHIIDLRWDENSRPYLYIYVSVFKDEYLQQFQREPIKTMKYFYNFLCKNIPEIYSIKFDYMQFYSEVKFII